MRLIRCVLAGWYVLASTNIPVFALDQLMPQTKTIASTDFPCAHHDCGCKTAEQCRLRCCCHPKPTARSQAKQLCHLPHQKPDQPLRTVRVSVLSSRYCETGQSHADALTLHKLEPHLPPVVQNARIWVPDWKPIGAEIGRPQIIFPDVPDKIPI